MNYVFRMEKILQKLQSLPGTFFWILEDSTHVPTTGRNDPMAFAVYPYPYQEGTPDVFPVSWGYSGAGSDTTELAASLFDVAIETVPFVKHTEAIRKGLKVIAPLVETTYTDGTCSTIPLDKAIQIYLWQRDNVSMINCDEAGRYLLSDLLHSIKTWASSFDDPEQFAQGEGLAL